MLDSNKSGGFFFRLIWKNMRKSNGIISPSNVRGENVQRIELPPPWIKNLMSRKKKHQIHPLISPVFLFRLMRFTRFNHSTLGRSSEGHLWTVCLVTSWWLLRWSWRIFNGKPSQQKNTAWMFKVATENISSQKETSIPPIFFQGLCSTLGVYYEKCPLNSCHWSEKNT